VVLCKYEKLPLNMQCSEVEYYYNILNKKRVSLVFKRIFDVIGALLLLIVAMPIMIVTSVLIKIDSKGTIFYRQERVTTYGKIFRIFKFRTMVSNADQLGTLVTVKNDSRITRIGKILRKYKIDELPQLIDVLRGTMTFVGTRPEVKKYVDQYTPEMRATLLMPAGITSLTSIFYYGESEMLDVSDNPDKTYFEDILPEKMKWNLKGILEFSFWKDIKILLMTLLTIFGKKYEENEYTIH